MEEAKRRVEAIKLYLKETKIDKMDLQFITGVGKGVLRDAVKQVSHSNLYLLVA